MHEKLAEPVTTNRNCMYVCLLNALTQRRDKERLHRLAEFKTKLNYIEDVQTLILVCYAVEVNIIMVYTDRTQ